MMPIKPVVFDLEKHHQATLEIATNQVTDLLKRVSEPHEYRILANADRSRLLKDGFASDLVDNLVYLTERSPEGQEKLNKDRHAVGFNAIAFDASLYAAKPIIQGLSKASDGRCYWCETPLNALGEDPNLVSHYRPPTGYLKNGLLRREAYAHLAYKTDNLMFCCPQCSQQNKGLQFPTLDERHAPAVSVQEEHPVLINPMQENPRDYIRFNPLNGLAYAFDLVKAFYLQKGMDEASIDAYLNQNAHNIPMQVDLQGNSLSEPLLDAEFKAWFGSLLPGDKTHLSRGQTSIDLLNLNRPTLITARWQHLTHLWLSAHKWLQANKSDPATSVIPPLANHAFVSLSTDALAAWEKDTKHNWDAWYETAAPSETVLASMMATTQGSAAFDVPMPVQSSLMYLVLESELTLKGVRRIVLLSSHDLLYASTTSKCVFLPIEWEKDRHNVVNVHENGATWKTTFEELVNTQFVSLQNLFSRSEIWAEGPYEALA